MGTSQVISSPEHSVPLEEDASKQGRNEEQNVAIGSEEANLMKVDGAQDVDTGIVSGVVQMNDDMEVESPQDMDGFVVTDK